MAPEPFRIAHLHCLYCGGERRGDDSACRLCNAEAPSVPCKRCGARVFAPRDECICGEACPAWDVAEESQLGCPRCKGKLGWVEVEDSVQVEQCARCLGCFVRTSSFSSLIEHEVKRAPGASPPSPEKFIPPTSAPSLPRQALLAEAPCPHCGIVMERARFAQKAAIVIDVCPAHGVWLDAGELTSLLAHVKRLAAGENTLDEADRADQQHWDHVLAERMLELSRVESQIRLAATPGPYHTRNVVIGTAVGGPWLGLFMAMRGRGR